MIGSNKLIFVQGCSRITIFFLNPQTEKELFFRAAINFWNSFSPSDLYGANYPTSHCYMPNLCHDNANITHFPSVSSLPAEMESAPRNVQVRTLSSSTMVITWEPPETPNGQVTVSTWHQVRILNDKIRNPDTGSPGIHGPQSVVRSP